MKGKLSSPQLDYVFEHLGHHAETGNDLRQLICYGEQQPGQGKSILFPASEKEMDLNKVIWIDGIPVLYPVDQDSRSFYTMEADCLCFHHDLLKSIFHLLSGYEEIKNTERDAYGRFPYSQSLQHRLKIIDKPLVNYYMEVLLGGMEQFCRKNSLPFRRNPLLSKATLMLSHDVDLISAYDFKETAYKFKQLLGLADSPFSPGGKFRDAFTALYHFMNPLSGKNPFWSFPRLMEWESEREFVSTYFFLERDGPFDNSRYRFHHRKIRKLIGDLSNKGHEIGIHGTMQSFDNPEAMGRTVGHLRAVSPKPVTGIRQHYLRFKPGITAGIQKAQGLSYDASLGFSEHDGFRNSYCWPFKFFDFDRQKTMDFWEIPLTLMDVTHFYHRRLSYDQSMEAVTALASEVVKFNGVFSLLWHNSFFDERVFPGITAHYTGILDHFKDLGMQGITGNMIIRHMRLDPPVYEKVPGKPGSEQKMP